MDKEDRVLAAIMTVIIVILSGMFLTIWLTALFAAPIITLVITAVVWVAARKIYPAVLEAMK